jgi:Ni,Fe-hydrogenase III large subunit/Ni,Fe-hydrogenase III component G
MADLKNLLELFSVNFKGEILFQEIVRGIPVFHIRKEAIQKMAVHLTHHPELNGILSMQWAVDLRPMKQSYRIYALFSLMKRGSWVILTLDLDGEDRLYPSITPRVHAAKWYEREIRDMYGLIAEGHPDLRRLIRHEHWPKGTHPLRKNFAWNSILGHEEGSYAYRKIEGEGVFEIPVGPIHAGIIEPGHFRFSVAGEPIMQMEIRLFWKHRGVEKLFENLELIKGIPLSERISGDSSFGHSLCYSQAVEAILSLEVPLRAQYLRSLFLELERLHNHLGDIGAICNDAAYALALSHCGRMKEQVMQINDRLAGHRFLRGVNKIGGVCLDLDLIQFKEIDSEMVKIEKDFRELSEILFVNASLTDRLETTGILKEQTARDHAAVGVVARASNIDCDTRRDHPFAAYDRLKFRIPVFQYGDVRARVRVRIEEIFESIALIQKICREIPEGPLSVEPVKKAISGDWSLSAVEGWRGEILYFVMAGENGLIQRCKVRDPSFVNWPALQYAVLGNIIPDFPLINKSFNLSYSGNDL